MDLKLNLSLKKFIKTSFIIAIILCGLTNISVAKQTKENTTPDKKVEATQENSTTESKEAKSFSPDSKSKITPFTGNTIKHPPVDNNTQVRLNTAPVNPQIEDIKTDNVGQPVQSPLVDINNPIGIAQPYVLLQQSLELLKKKDIAGAKKIIEPLAEWLTEATEYHSILFKRLNEIDSAKNQAQVEKKIAFETALLRDKSFYLLGQIYLAENNYRKAIKYLVDVIKSQPKSETAMKAYETLQQIGFTEKVRMVP